MFLDVPGFLFTAAAGRLDRDNTSTRISASETQRAADLQQKAKKQSGACPVNNLGTKVRDGSSCGSGTVQHHHVRTTFLSLRQLHYSHVWIHLFPLECKMPQSVTPAQFLIATHICSSSSQTSHHPSRVTHTPPPQTSYKIHVSKEKKITLQLAAITSPLNPHEFLGKHIKQSV